MEFAPGTALYFQFFGEPPRGDAVREHERALIALFDGDEEEGNREQQHKADRLF